MTPKKSRADKKTIEQIFKKGRSVSSPSLSFKFINNRTAKISFIAPKSVSRSAVKRNLLRRRGYAALNKYLDRLPPVAGAFIFKKYEDNLNILDNEIASILNKIN